MVKISYIPFVVLINNDDNKEGGDESLKGSGYMRREIPRPLKLGAKSLQPEGLGNSGESVGPLPVSVPRIQRPALGRGADAGAGVGGGRKRLNFSKLQRVQVLSVLELTESPERPHGVGLLVIQA